MKIEPENPVAMRHAARAYVKTGTNQDRLKEILETLLLPGKPGTAGPGDPQWDVWTRGQVVRLGRSDPDRASPVLPKASPASPNASPASPGPAFSDSPPP